MTDRFRTNLSRVPHVGGLREDEGWIDMQVQFLIDKPTAGTNDFLLGWTVLPPGARHDRHLHRNADEFFVELNRIVLENEIEVETVAPADESVNAVYDYLIGEGSGGGSS